jgi:hypothetical protein
MDDKQRIENQRMLAATLGIPDEEAATKLDLSVQVTWADEDAGAASIGGHVTSMLARTFTSVGTSRSPGPAPVVEVLIQGAAHISTAALKIYCCIDRHLVRICEEPPRAGLAPVLLPSAIDLLVACFIAARTADRALGLGKCGDAPFTLDIEAWLGAELSVLDEPVDLGRLHVAGAGAVGNAFAYSLVLLPVRGELQIVDPKPVTGGILNRCLCFGSADLGHSKAQQLASWINARLGSLKATSFIGMMSDLRLSDPTEIECLVSGVDSRGGRRRLQEEVPKEVFDASTTGIDEVVFHHNHITVDGACLACIYPQTAGEVDFERHLAEKLHVSIVEVRTGYISEAAARRIVGRYPQLSVQHVTGMAYDSLFKQLCATQQLTGPEQRQVLAPFAFVSQLAGAVLSLEMFLRRRRTTSGFNYWRVSPWRSPNLELRTLRPRLQTCSVCADPIFLSVTREVWAQADHA